jgi:N-acetylmuramoyl-L-alanine amidase
MGRGVRAGIGRAALLLILALASPALSAPKSPGRATPVRTRAAPKAKAVPDAPPAAPFRVALDPGHGGLATGAIGPAGVYEKHVALSLALRVRDLLQGRPGLEVLLTRETDVDLDLPDRPARAAAAGADAFVSLHLNASTAPEARGIETFFLGPASDPAADALARTENAEAVTPVPVDDDPAVASIVSDLRRNGNLAWSARLAEALYARLVGAIPETPSRKVRQGNFAVLRRAGMPAVVVEMGFLTHPQEGLRLVTPAYQDRLARAVAAGIEAFAKDTAAERAAMAGSP